jgi:hypothetical protein
MSRLTLPALSGTRKTVCGIAHGACLASGDDVQPARAYF